MSPSSWLCKLRRMRLTAAEDSQEWMSSICWLWRLPTSAPGRLTHTGMQPTPARELLALSPALQAAAVSTCRGKVLAASGYLIY